MIRKGESGHSTVHMASEVHSRARGSSVIDWAFGGEHSGRHGSKSSGGDNQVQAQNVHQKATGRHDPGEAAVTPEEGEISEASPGTSYDSPANQNQAVGPECPEGGVVGSSATCNAAGTSLCCLLVVRIRCSHKATSTPIL